MLKPKKFPNFTKQICKMKNWVQAISHTLPFRCTICYLFLIAFCLMPSALKAQDTIKRPKIGVVLSGGGAKGFAHIGVLKIIDSLGIKVDYIGGTSMGSVVGGLYASGYTGKQLDSLFHTINFDQLIRDYIPRSYKSFYEKQNDELYAITLPFYKFNVGLPIALSKGMYNFNILSKFTNHVKHINNFNELPTPFVCIATNVETGEPVVFKEGCLSQAILASSAFPSLFSPVYINGKMLIDGGVIDNYPVEEVKKMGADIIIGVDVQDELKNRALLKDATKIMIQISNLQMIEKMNHKIKLTDIYIKPNIKDYTVVSFDAGDKIIDTGKNAALEKLLALKKLSTQYTKPLLLECKNDSLSIDNIEITKMKNYTNSYILGKLGVNKNHKISYSDFIKGVNTLDATQNFSSILYRFEKKDDVEILKVDLIENKIKTFLKFGLHYDGLYKSALLTNFTQKRMLFKNDVLSIDFGWGDNFRYNLDYFIDNGFHFSFGIKSRVNQFNRNIATAMVKKFSTSTNAINIHFLDFTNQIYIQTKFAQKFVIGAGLETKHLKIFSKQVEDANIKYENSTYFSGFGNLKYDSFDNKFFPKKGWFFNGDVQYFAASTDYSKTFNNFTLLKGAAGITKTVFKRFNLNIQSEAGMSIGESSVPFLNFALGGYGFQTINNFRHFYGYDFLSISADSYIKTSAMIDIEFYKKNHINFSANIANVEDKLFSTGNWISTPKYSGYAIGYGLETILGPIEIKYSWSPELPKGYTWFSVGFWF